MELHVTLAAGPGGSLPSGAATEEIVVDTARLTTGEQLRRHLSARTGNRFFHISGQPLETLQPQTPPLNQGAVIVASGRAPENARASERPTLLFLVRSGPDSGRAVPLARGTYTIGRSQADITIDDPEISRTHALLTVAENSVVLRDRHSANGVWLDGLKVEQEAITTTSDVRLGASRCSLILADAPAGPTAVVDLDEPCEVECLPPPDVNRLLILTAFLPLVFGIVLAVTTGMWFFLAFSALSAVTGVVPLVSGMRKRKAFSAAVSTAADQDRERRRRAARDIGAILIAARTPDETSVALRKSVTSPGGYLRLGTADQPANLLVRPSIPGWENPVLHCVPVLVPLGARGQDNQRHHVNLDIVAPREFLPRVAYLLLIQLSTLQEAGGIVCFGPSSDLPGAARFLPGVRLVSNRSRLDRIIADGSCSSVLLFGRELDLDLRGARLYRLLEDRPARPADWSVDYYPSEPVLTTPEAVVAFQPDLVHSDTFEAIARAVGSHSGSSAAARSIPPLPRRVALSDLAAADRAGIVSKWVTRGPGSQLCTAIGSSSAGGLTFDLVADGPHLLVVGTTGAGKSEFLRSLVSGLALNHSPADLNFLLIDFKGGSGLGTLAALPHAVGLLTDLSPASVSRALTSLKAEVKRRESLFAAVGAADYNEYRERSNQSVRLPRLVTVIDEFRVLSEEVPGSLADLMRIATLGRSLGMHLVLATQRPQGAVTSDIRANITSSVTFRVQSEVESQDVLGSSLAAAIPVELPGRAYLRVGAREPVEFQAATTTSTAAAMPGPVISFSSYLDGSAAESEVEGAAGPAQEEAGAEALCAAARAAADDLGLPPLREPIRPPLPPALLRAEEAGTGLAQLGMLDLPEQQEQRFLCWNPERDSHLAFVGLPGSGLTSAISHATGELLQYLPDTHLYILDGDASLRSLAHAPQVGAYVNASEVTRAARVIERLAGTVLAGLNGDDRSRLSPPTAVVLIITGWGRWVSAFAAGRHASTEGALLDIVRDGETAGVTVIIGGGRELTTARFFSMLPNRIYLPLGAGAETVISWPKLPAMDHLPGRAFVQGRISVTAGAVAQLILEPVQLSMTMPAQLPFPVHALPRRVSDTALKPAPADLHPALIPIGVGGDDLGVMHLGLPAGTAALVVGAAGTGKTKTLDLIAVTAPPALRRLRPAQGADPVLYWRESALIGSTGNELLLVDNADRLSRETHHQIAQLVAAGARAVLTAAPSQALASVCPLAANLRLNPLGLVLGPRSAFDGDLFGLRLEVDGTAPPGRGLLVDSRGPRLIQVAHAG